jgi:hypothetical protein
MTIEINNQLKFHIKVVNDNQNHIHDVVVVETNVVVLRFGVVMAYAIVSNSPMKTKRSDDNQCL